MNKAKQNKRQPRRQATRNNRPARKNGMNGNGGSASLALSRRMQTALANGKPFTIPGREYVTPVSALSTGALSLTTVTINPGLGASFPWLSQIAGAFESYQFNSLKFEYVPSRNATKDGSVHLALEYDVADSAPGSVSEFMANTRAVTDSIWKPVTYTSNLRDANVLGVRRYVRPGAVPSGKDARAYDIGNIYVGTSGADASAVYGNLYVDYNITFYTPQRDVAGAASARSAKVAGNTGVDKTHIFGTTAATVTGDLPVSAITNTLTFNAVGQYLVIYDMIGTGTGSASTAVTGTNLTWTRISGVANGADTNYVQYAIVTVVSPGATALFDQSGATTISAESFRISTYAFANA